MDLSHDNAVIDGKVENTKTCLRFEGTYDNTVDGFMLDDECQVTMVPMGGQAASGNVVPHPAASVTAPSTGGSSRSRAPLATGKKRQTRRVMIVLAKAVAEAPTGTENGESLAYVRDQSIKQTVDTYGHLVPGPNRAAVDRLDDATGHNQ